LQSQSLPYSLKVIAIGYTEVGDNGLMSILAVKLRLSTQAAIHMYPST